jgi:Methylamine utilisation protein MauE
MIDPVWSLALRAGLALLLASAAVAKLRDLGDFTEALAGYRLLPASLARPAAGVFAGAELVLALGLWPPALRAVSALGAALLLSLYGFAIAVNLARGRRDIDCGCGGPFGRQSLSEALVLRNALLVGAALAAALPVAQRALGWLDVWTLVAAAGAMAALYAAANVLLARSVLLR